MYHLSRYEFQLGPMVVVRAVFGGARLVSWGQWSFGGTILGIGGDSDQSSCPSSSASGSGVRGIAHAAFAVVSGQAL